MFQRAISALFLIWALGFVLFALTLPGPTGSIKTDGAIVLTGGDGRVARGLEVLRKGWTSKLLVAGVDKEVRPREFAAQFGVSSRLMACCVTLGFDSVDTRSNADEASNWMLSKQIKSVRLITTDWHMRRAATELDRVAPPELVVVEDAIISQPSFETLFLEYNKLLARWAARLTGA